MATDMDIDMDIDVGVVEELAIPDMVDIELIVSKIDITMLCAGGIFKYHI